MSESFQDSMNDMPNISETKMVAFDAYRDKPFHEDQKYITFDGMKVNVGGGFDPKSGMVSVSDVSNYIDNYFKIYTFQHLISTIRFFLHQVHSSG